MDVIHVNSMDTLCLLMPMRICHKSHSMLSMLPPHSSIKTLPIFMLILVLILISLGFRLPIVYYAMICAEIDSILVWIDYVYWAYFSNGKNISFFLSLHSIFLRCLTIIGYVDRILCVLIRFLCLLHPLDGVVRFRCASLLPVPGVIVRVRACIGCVLFGGAFVHFMRLFYAMIVVCCLLFKICLSNLIREPF